MASPYTLNPKEEWEDLFRTRSRINSVATHNKACYQKPELLIK